MVEAKGFVYHFEDGTTECIDKFSIAPERGGLYAIVFLDCKGGKNWKFMSIQEVEEFYRRLQKHLKEME